MIQEKKRERTYVAKYMSVKYFVFRIGSVGKIYHMSLEVNQEQRLTARGKEGAQQCRVDSDVQHWVQQRTGQVLFEVTRYLGNKTPRAKRI